MGAKLVFPTAHLRTVSALSLKKSGRRARLLSALHASRQAGRQLMPVQAGSGQRQAGRVQRKAGRAKAGRQGLVKGRQGLEKAGMQCLAAGRQAGSGQGQAGREDVGQTSMLTASGAAHPQTLMACVVLLHVGVVAENCKQQGCVSG